MKPITKLASSTLPDGSVLDLWERDGFHFLLRDGVQTASSFSYGSNEAAAAMAAAPVKRANQPSFLLDGLGLGFTLFALMDQIRREKARFIVAEPCKPLIDWHKELMNQERPGFLHDPRVSVEFAPALQIARKNPKSFHAILSHESERRRGFRLFCRPQAGRPAGHHGSAPGHPAFPDTAKSGFRSKHGSRSCLT